MKALVMASEIDQEHHVAVIDQPACVLLADAANEADTYFLWEARNQVHLSQECINVFGPTTRSGLYLCLIRQESVAFVMPYIAHDQFHQYYDKMSPVETQLYLRNRLVALKRVHDFNEIHRDVKPSNFLHNRKQQKFLLVDFGLAQDISRRGCRLRTGVGTGAGDEGNQQGSEVVVQQKQKKIKLEADNLENSTTPAGTEPSGKQQQQQPPVVFKTFLKQSNQALEYYQGSLQFAGQVDCFDSSI
ncbi:cell division control protein [Culex quinquefasciatus]|uniref:non-specific serine/threonine protein kinase n=1 Tax=Culex quinquefasciatus TaxID=7176 RepID=B0WWB9_CULQU|nr:cell division control protein [Culex quinquefasciatus]|eukprot:XP_001861691.1 cell division control protein [Culex quinquefasciatus]